MSASPTRISGSSNRIRRRRVTTACSACRDRRVKCDRIRPSCTQCKRGDRTCKYVDKDTPKIEFVTGPRSQVTGLARSTPPSSNTWSSVIENQIDLVKKSDDVKDGVPVWAVAEAEEPSRAQAMQLNTNTTRPYIIPIRAIGEEFISALISDLPSQDICQPFFESFIHSIHPIIPVCHIPNLRREYEDFWANMSPSYSVESLALVLAVLYTGAANSKQVDILKSSTLLRLYEEIFVVVDFTSYYARNITVSIQILQGYIIMNTWKASHLAPFSAYGFLPQAIRFAQSLRLHVDMKTGDPVELEVRRCIWWHLLFLDIESTVATGLPPIIHRTGYTTQLPSFLREIAISTPMVSGSQPHDFCPVTLAMQGHFQWAHRMQTWFEKLPSQEEVFDFKILVENLISLVPKSNHHENEWAKVYLEMQIDRAYCMLGLRFWQLDQYKGTGCQSEVVITARSFLTHYLYLSTLPSTHHFTWFIPGLIQPLHAVIILLMHLSTCSNIPSEERSRKLLDQILGLRVDHILNGSIFPMKALQPCIDRSQRTNPRYLILVELKKRVWRKLGWDSDGRGVDPWGGRLEQGEVVGGGEEETVREVKDQVTVLGIGSAKDMAREDWDKDWGREGTTGLEGLDTILAGDPLDMLQWDEWESLASEFFAS